MAKQLRPGVINRNMSGLQSLSRYFENPAIIPGWTTPVGIRAMHLATDLLIFEEINRKAFFDVLQVFVLFQAIVTNTTQPRKAGRSTSSGYAGRPHLTGVAP